MCCIQQVEEAADRLSDVVGNDSVIETTSKVGACVVSNHFVG